MLSWEGILLTEPSLQALRFVSNLGPNLRVTYMTLKIPPPSLLSKTSLRSPHHVFQMTIPLTHSIFIVLLTYPALSNVSG